MKVPSIPKVGSSRHPCDGQLIVSGICEIRVKVTGLPVAWLSSTHAGQARRIGLSVSQGRQGGRRRGTASPGARMRQSCWT